MFSLEGGSDLGYSEAIYFHDPESNSIERYWVKPVNQWDILGDRQIVGVSEALDGKHLMTLIQCPFTNLPHATHMGHFHLSV